MEILHTFEGHEFSLVGAIEPLLDYAGKALEELPQSRYRNADRVPLNNYGHGPFCRFRVAKGRRESGVYVIMNAQTVLYVGECQNLEDRYSSNGYGGISPRNCFKGGQETNCRINNLILETVNNGGRPTLWFHPSGEGKSARVEMETHLMAALRPTWNRGLF